MYCGPRGSSCAHISSRRIACFHGLASCPPYARGQAMVSQPRAASFAQKARVNGSARGSSTNMPRHQAGSSSARKARSSARKPSSSSVNAKSMSGRDRQDAAVDAERAAGDPARVRRGEEDDQPGDVGGLAHAPGGNRAPAERLGEHLLDRPPGRRSARARRLLDRLGADEAGYDAVREDTVLREGVGQALREVDESRLGGGVGREERVGLAADARGDVDDAPAALRAHERHAGERETDGAHEVEREARLPVGPGELEEPPGRAPAGVVDQHVEAAEARYGALDDELPAGLGGDVGGDRLDLPAAGADLISDGPQCLAAARVDRQVRAHPGQLEGDRAPDPLARAGAEGDLAGELNYSTPSARSCSTSVAASLRVPPGTSAVCWRRAGAWDAAKAWPAT